MSIFDGLLRKHQAERHARLLGSGQLLARSQSVGIDGFLPPKEAAKAMGVSVDELLSLVDRGHLEARDVGWGFVHVRPAVVSVLAVREESSP